MTKPTYEVKSWHNFSVDAAIDLDMEIFRGVKAFNLASLQSDKRVIDSVIERFNLEYFMEYFMTMNSSLYIPYHNLYHTRCMILNCYEGSYYERLHVSETRGLLVGSMLHDFCHPGNSKSDRQNVNIALNGLENAQAFAMSVGLGLDGYEYQIANEVIDITTYPYEKEPTTITQLIIRDADLMQLYEEDQQALVKQYLGLKAEMEVTRDVKYTNEEFAIGLKAWQEANSVWHTRWANDKAQKRNLQECLNRLYQHISNHSNTIT